MTTERAELAMRLKDHADSLVQQARWIRAALDPNAPDGFDLGDVDTDELDAAAKECRQAATSLAQADAEIERLKMKWENIGQWTFRIDPRDGFPTIFKNGEAVAMVLTGRTDAKAGVADEIVNGLNTLSRAQAEIAAQPEKDVAIAKLQAQMAGLRGAASDLQVAESSLPTLSKRPLSEPEK